MAGRQNGKAPHDNQQDAKVSRNKKRDQNKQQKHNDVWFVRVWGCIHGSEKDHKLPLTTEMFSFSESDFFDFFDFFLPLSFFFSPFSCGALSGISWIARTASLPDKLSIDLPLTIDDCWWTALCWTTLCCSTTSTEPLLKEFSKLSPFDEVIDEDSVVETPLDETTFFFDVVLLDFLTVFLTTVVSDSKLSTADYINSVKRDIKIKNLGNLKLIVFVRV